MPQKIALCPYDSRDRRQTYQFSRLSFRNFWFEQPPPLLFVIPNQGYRIVYRRIRRRSEYTLFANSGCGRTEHARNGTDFRIALHYSQQQGQQRYFVLSENYWEKKLKMTMTRLTIWSPSEKKNFCRTRVFNVSQQIARGKKEESCDFNTP